MAVYATRMSQRRNHRLPGREKALRDTETLGMKA
jgi:hypothetical protein